MIHQQNTKVLNTTPPAAIIDDASAVTTEIDTLGWGYVTIYVNLGATDIALTALKVQESATSGSGFADITGLVFGTSTNTDGSTSALPIATDDNKIFAFEIDMRKRERYLDVVCTFDDGTVGGFVQIETILSKPNSETTPTTAALRGCEEILRV